MKKVAVYFRHEHQLRIFLLRILENKRSGSHVAKLNLLTTSAVDSKILS
jgi:hypothetical protein